MSIELTLIPLAIAAGVIARRELERRRQNEHYIQTLMRDPRLLYDVLRQEGCEVEVDGDVMTTVIGDYPTAFSKDSQSVYAACLNGEMKSEDAIKIVTGLEEKYGKALQQQEYQKLMAGAKQRGYGIQTNEMLPDDVIHLVLTLPGTPSGQLDIQAKPDGKVDVHVAGVKGSKCTEYASELETMLEARAADYTYTDEYYETGEVASGERSAIRLEDE